MIYLYALLDPDTQAIRYIGQTINPDLRLKQHKKGGSTWEHKKAFTKNQWMEQLHRAKKQPIMTVLSSVPDHLANQEELRLIKHYEDLGCELLNTNGNRESKNKRKFEYKTELVKRFFEETRLPKNQNKIYWIFKEWWYNQPKEFCTVEQREFNKIVKEL